MDLPRTSVVASILVPGVETALAAIRAVPSHCDLVELRADRLDAAQIGAIVRHAGRPLIVTLRRPADFGFFVGDESERLARLRAGLDAGARFVDVEWGTPAAAALLGTDRARLIFSHHGVPCKTEELEAAARALEASGAVLLKLVARAQDPSEILALRDVLARPRRAPLCAFALGPAGSLSRLLACAWGSWGTYAAPRENGPTAPGQFSLEEMLGHYDCLRIGPTTRLFGLAGAAVLGRSPSPAMHNAGYAALKIDARYLPLEAASWETVTRLADGLGLAGLAVTTPHKGDAARRCDTLDEIARVAHAVNSVRIDAGRWHGANTDGAAALALLTRHVRLEGLRVAIFGSGGAARGCAAGMLRAGARVTLHRRSGSTRPAGGPWAEQPLAAWDPGATDVLINATPVDGLSLAGEARPARLAVLDAVYGSGPTPLVRAAREHGLAAVDGFELLVEQAERQFLWHVGQPPPAGLFAESGQHGLSGQG